MKPDKPDWNWQIHHILYAGVAPEEVNEGFNFEETLQKIHIEPEELSAGAVHPAATIKKNFEEPEI